MKKNILLFAVMAFLAGCALFPSYFVNKANEIAINGGSWKLVGSADFSASVNWNGYISNKISLTVLDGGTTGSDKLSLAYVAKNGELHAAEYDEPSDKWYDTYVTNNVGDADSISMVYMTSNVAVPYVAFHAGANTYIYGKINGAWNRFFNNNNSEYITLLESDYSTADVRSFVFGDSTGVNLMANFTAAATTINTTNSSLPIQASRIPASQGVLVGYLGTSSHYDISFVDNSGMDWQIADINFNSNTPDLYRFGLVGKGENPSNYSAYLLYDNNESSGMVHLVAYNVTNNVLIPADVLHDWSFSVKDLDLEIAGDTLYVALLDGSTIRVYSYYTKDGTLGEVGSAITDVDAACLDLAVDENGNDLYIAYVHMSNNDRVEVRHYKVQQ